MQIEIKQYKLKSYKTIKNYTTEMKNYTKQTKLLNKNENHTK